MAITSSININITKRRQRNYELENAETKNSFGDIDKKKYVCLRNECGQAVPDKKV